MATKALGKDIIFSVFDDPIYKPVACNISCELTSSMEITPRLPLSDGKWKEFRGDSLEWGVFCENIIILDDVLSKAGVPLLVLTQHNMIELLAQFTISAGGLDYVLSGKVIIPSIVLSGAATGFGNASVEFKGTGPLTISNDIPVPTITIETTGVGDGEITSLILRDPSTLAEWTFVGSIPVGSTESWVLTGFGGQPGPGEYYIEAIVTSDQATNHFIVDAPPTANVAVGSGTTNLDSAPFGNSVAFDFTESRTITFLVGS